MLERLGLEFTTCAHEASERDLELNVDLEQRSSVLSFAKAKSLKLENENIVLGSDQICLFENQTLNKSGSQEAAIQQLLKLSGKTHKLYTSYTLLFQDKVFEHTEITTLEMKQLSEQQITRYVRYDNPVDCAGSYKIENGGIALFEKITTNDFHSIIGLPLTQLIKDLAKLGVSPWN